MAATRAGLADGTVDVVVGTHALLAKGIAFRDLGLLVVDEEQHFGVKHKERLKELKADVQVLTLSATPIPRTLQLALTGVRELSLITTPPIDRLAVRTFISPFDRWWCGRRCCASAIAAGKASTCARGSATSRNGRHSWPSTCRRVKVAVANGQMAAGGAGGRD